MIEIINQLRELIRTLEEKLNEKQEEIADLKQERDGYRELYQSLKK